MKLILRMRVFCLIAILSTTFLAKLAISDEKPEADMRLKFMGEYSQEYCLSLELAYGKGMMSEGGYQGIEEMFDGIFLDDKQALEIGSGLGGAAIYLALEHNMDITGVEVNPWMVQESTKRIPAEKNHQINFKLIENNRLPFEDNSFDIVYSKGVLTHVPDKKELFKEIHRVLKSGGKLVIVDWLSPTKDKWGPILTKISEDEKLDLFAQTQDGYFKDLEACGFEDVIMQDYNSKYANYNRTIAGKLRGEKKAEFVQNFGKQTLIEHVDGYDAIAQAIETNELLVRHFVAVKL